MNALFAREAKQLLLGFALLRHPTRLATTLRDAGLIGGLQRVAHAPHAHVVEVQAVAVARLQGLDGEVRLGDAGEEFVGGRGGSPGRVATTP